MLVRIYEYSTEDFRYTGFNVEVDIDVPEGTNLYEVFWPEGRTHVKPPEPLSNHEVPVFDPLTKKWSLQPYYPEIKYYLIDENGRLIDNRPRYGKPGESYEYLSQFPKYLPDPKMVDPIWTGSAWIENATLDNIKKAKLKELDAEYDNRLLLGYQTSIGYKVKITPTDFSIWQFGMQNLNAQLEAIKQELINQGMTEEEALTAAKSQVVMPYIKDYDDVVHKDIPYDTYKAIVDEVSAYLNNLWIKKAALIAGIQESEDVDLIKSITLDSDPSVFTQTA
jgi:hypothetical protein